MHLARRTAFRRTVPIIDAISRVAILLDLDYDVARTERVEPAARQKNRVAPLHLETVKILFDSSVLDTLRELLRCGSFFKPRIDPCLRCRVGHKPQFRFRFTAKLFRDRFRRMDLERKIFPRVEELAKNRETPRFRYFPENGGAMLAPKGVERFAAQGSLMDDALRLRPIDDLPRLTDQRR